MSFSNNIKNELSRDLPSSRCCQIAELAGLVRMDGTILISGRNKMGLELVTENAAVARKTFKLLKLLFSVDGEIIVQRKNRLKKNNMYLVRIPNSEKVTEVLNVLGIGQYGLLYNPTISERIVKKGCCRRSYLRGVFLGAGSLSDPESGYHLELVTNSEEFAQSLVDLMEQFELSPKMSPRKSWTIVYLKESEQIVTFLNIIGAHKALLEIENIRIHKEMRNQVNRLVNCETANMNKTINAGLKQKENIEIIAARIGLHQLPPNLQQVAELRLTYPEISLKELGEMVEPKLGKSGINHRMRKLQEIAEELMAK